MKRKRGPILVCVIVIGLVVIVSLFDFALRGGLDWGGYASGMFDSVTEKEYPDYIGRLESPVAPLSEQVEYVDKNVSSLIESAWQKRISEKDGIPYVPGDEIRSETGTMKHGNVRITFATPGVEH